MPMVRKRFRKGDHVIVSMHGCKDEYGVVLSGPKRLFVDSIWYTVVTPTFGADVHESVLVFAD